MSNESGGQSFLERYAYFRRVLHPSLLLKSTDQLLMAQNIVQNPQHASPQQLQCARTLYDSAFHPDTGQINPVLGRMAFQIPGNVAVVAAMLTFFKSSYQVVGLQFVNQAFMAFCNYTNRNAKSPLSDTQAAAAFGAATVAAVGASLGLRRAFRDTRSPLVAKLVPFMAVCAGNFCNVPLMRQSDLTNGIVVADEHGNPLGLSQKVGLICVAQVVITRILTCIPMMVGPPVILTSLEKRRVISSRSIPGNVLQALLIGVCTFYTLPMACAAFPQTGSLPVAMLEPHIHANISDKSTLVYFNKGL
jgi:tricarboxylate carrier